MDLCPMEIKVDAVKGRILVASRDIEPGELLLEDSHLAFGPKEVVIEGSLDQFCVGCLNSCSTVCGQCDLPHCLSQECAEFHRDECAAMFEKVKSAPWALRMGLVAPYRLAKAMCDHPDVQEQVKSLMDHEEDRERNLDHQKRVQEMREVALLSQGPPDLDRHLNRAIGLLHVNALDVGRGRGRVIFPLFSYASHSCVNNCKHLLVDDELPKAVKIRLYSQVSIAQGQEITITYINLFRHTFARQAALAKQWFFTCQCDRCLDPTELKTGINLVYCPSCTQSYLMPEPSEPTTTECWSCLACSKAITEEQLLGFLDVLKDKLDAIHPPQVDALEKFLVYSTPFVHPFHYLCLIAKRYLSQLYDEEDPDQAAKKRLVAHELMVVFDVLDPGLSQSRGLTMIEMIKGEIGLAKGEEVDVDTSEIRTEKVQLVEQSLVVEPQGSLGRQALEKFRTFMAQTPAK